MTNLAYRLWYARQRAHLTQTAAAARSGVGVKSISSFECGDRTEAMKVAQLLRLLSVYGVTLVEFAALDYAQRPDDPFLAVAAHRTPAVCGVSR
jgi:transcriptional regulator with XRE-family HTH domain